MTSIDTMSHYYLSLYANSNSGSGASDLLNTISGSVTNEETQTRTQDTVSLSSGVTTARSREYLGLPPTGKLTLSHFETAAAQQKQTVSTLLASTMEELGVDSDQTATLSLDENGDILIMEDFAGKDQLEEALNNDPDFSQAFAGLSANTEVMDYTDLLKTRTNNIADYFNRDAGDSNLSSLASRYAALKSSTSSIQTLWSLSRSQTPYAFQYNPTQ